MSGSELVPEMLSNPPWGGSSDSGSCSLAGEGKAANRNGGEGEVGEGGHRPPAEFSRRR